MRNRSRKSFRRRSYRSRAPSSYQSRQKSSALQIALLALITLVLTITVLFLLSKGAPQKAAAPSPKKAVETQKKESKTAGKVSVAKKPKTTEQKKIAKRTAPAPKPAVKKRGKIAIVLDDWGYNTNNVDGLLGIGVPITISILPFRDYSRTIAEIAYHNNAEVILHMPMEPKERQEADLEPKTLRKSMNTSVIRSLVADAFLSVPYAKGMNNHMGSYATTDERMMAAVFEELHLRKAFFLDSFVVSDSVCEHLAKKKGIRFAKRSIFLDNSLDKTYIKNQIMKLARTADKYGFAVGIGHDRKNTLMVLHQVIPELTEQGYQFVCVSQIVE